MMTNGDPEGWIFLSDLHINNGPFSCSSLNTALYISKWLPQVPELAEIQFCGSQREKPCLWRCANKGADQPAHPHSLISAFIIRLLESIISMFATSEISIF